MFSTVPVKLTPCKSRGICGVLIQCVNTHAQQNPNTKHATARIGTNVLINMKIKLVKNPMTHKIILGSVPRLKYNPAPNAIKNGTHRNKLPN